MKNLNLICKMEEILKKLQAIHLQAFKMKVPTFYITTYHWDDTPESPDVIVVHARKTDDDDDVFYGRIYPDRPDTSVIPQLKTYLGL